MAMAMVDGRHFCPRCGRLRDASDFWAVERAEPLPPTQRQQIVEIGTCCGSSVGRGPTRYVRRTASAPSAPCRVVDATGSPMTPPTHARGWQVATRHPLAGRPREEQISDEEADAYAVSIAPDGWVLGRRTIQGRDRRGNRVMWVTYHRP